MKAIEYFQRSLEIKSDYVDALIGMAIAYTQQEKFDEALSYYDRVSWFSVKWTNGISI